MVSFLTQVVKYDNPWHQVTIAIFQKYPNPFASHVLTSDVIDRHVDPETGVLHTTRLFLKKGTVPKWAASVCFFKKIKSKLLRNPEAYILEVSSVDLKNRTMKTVTRNLSLKKLMMVEETQYVTPLDNGDGTCIVAKARIVSSTGWTAIRERIESFGISKFKDNTIKSTKGLRHVLENLKDRFQQTHE